MISSPTGTHSRRFGTLSNPIMRLQTEFQESDWKFELANSYTWFSALDRDFLASYNGPNQTEGSLRNAWFPASKTWTRSSSVFSSKFFSTLFELGWNYYIFHSVHPWISSIHSLGVNSYPVEYQCYRKMFAKQCPLVIADLRCNGPLGITDFFPHPYLLTANVYSPYENLPIFLHTSDILHFFQRFAEIRHI